MSVALRKSPVESWEDHVEAWHHLGREVDGAAWGRAAIAASLKGRYGEDSVGKFAAEVGFSAASVYHFARTFGAFPEKSERSQNLTFSHHLLAAKLTATAAEAKAAVDMAEREGWSANALRAYLRPARPVRALPAEACNTESCGPITDADRVVHIWAFVENFYAVKDYDAKSLVDQSTKKSAKELLQKLNQIQEWFTTMQAAIKERIG